MNNTKAQTPNKWLFNPFIYIAGKQALFIGWAAMLAATFVAWLSHTHFDGAIDIHFGSPAKYIFYLFEQFVAWSSTTIIFYVIGIVFSKSRIRLIDIAGTVSMARAITLPIAILGFLPIFPVNLESPFKLALAAIPAIIFGVWMVALLFNAFVVSTNIRGNKAVVCFIAGLLAAEILSKILIYFLSRFL